MINSLNAPSVDPMLTIVKELEEKEDGYYKLDNMGIMGGSFSFSIAGIGVSVDNAFVTVLTVSEQQKLYVIQANASVDLASFFVLNGTFAGAHNPLSLFDALTVFDKQTSGGDSGSGSGTDWTGHFPLFWEQDNLYDNPLKQASANNGIYLLQDTKTGEIVSQNQVFTVTGLFSPEVLKKLGLDITLTVGASFSMNSFTEKKSGTIGVLLKLASGIEVQAVGGVSFHGSSINGFYFEVKSDVLAIGPVTLSRIKLAADGLQVGTSKYSVGLGAAFGRKVKVSLPAPVKKLLPKLADGVFPVEVNADTTFATDASYIYLGVTGSVFDMVNFSGSWEHVKGEYDEIAFKVGTTRNPNFNLSLEGSAKWSDKSLTVQGTFSGNFRWEWSWKSFSLATDVSGRIAVVYSKLYETGRETLTLSLAGSGTASVKVWRVQIKVGANASGTWTWNLSDGTPKTLSTAMALSSVERPAEPFLLRAVNAASPTDAWTSGGYTVNYSESWSQSDGAENGKLRITVAARYSLERSNWVLKGSNGETFYGTPSDLATTDSAVAFRKISHDIWELSMNAPAAGTWTLDVYTNGNWSGEVLAVAEYDRILSPTLAIRERDANHITFDYDIGSTGANGATLYLCMEENDSAEHKGTVVAILDDASGTFVWQRPEDIQGGDYRFYLMAVAENSSQPGYSEYTGSEHLAINTADLRIEDLIVSQSGGDSGGNYQVTFTVRNMGQISSGEFHYTISASLKDLDDKPSATLSTGVIADLAHLEATTITVNTALPANLWQNMVQLKVTLDEADLVEEGIFETNNSASRDLCYSTATRAVANWSKLLANTEYVVLEYALDNDFSDTVRVTGLTGSSCELLLGSGGGYHWRVAVADAEGNPQESGWTEYQRFSVDEELDFNWEVERDGKQVLESKTFTLKDGIYSLSDFSIGALQGTLTLYQVNDKNGKLKRVYSSSLAKLAQANTSASLELLNADYRIHITTNARSTADSLDFSLSGTPFPDYVQDKSPIVLAGDDEMSTISTLCNTETVSGWVGTNEKNDRWDFVTDDAGEVTITLSGAHDLTGAMQIAIYEQNGNTGKFRRKYSVRVAAGSSDGQLVFDSRFLTGNFYVEVTTVGKQNTFYSLDVSYRAFSNVDAERFVEWDQADARVEGFVGYGEPSDEYLLEVDSGEAGTYSITLSANARSARLRLYSLSGRCLKTVTVGKDGVASLDGMQLYSGTYVIMVESADSGKGRHNTDYQLSVNQTGTVAKLDETLLLGSVEPTKQNKLFFAFDANTGSYDLSAFKEANISARVYSGNVSGKLSTVAQKRNTVNLLASGEYYLELSWNKKYDISDYILALDDDKRFTLESSGNRGITMLA